MKFMTVLIFFSGKVCQSGPGHKAGNLQFMQTLSLLRKALFFSQNVPIKLAFLFFLREKSFLADVAAWEFVVCAI